MANLFEGIPDSWLQSENIEDVTPDVIEWLRNRKRSPAVKEIADTAIETLGPASEYVAGKLGAQPRHGLFVDAKGNKYDIKTGGLLEAARNTYAENMASNEPKITPIGAPEVDLNWRQPVPLSQRIGDKLAQFIGRPKVDPVQVGRDVIDQGKAYADSLGFEQNQ